MSTKHGVHITWLGHAAFKIRTPGGEVILIDPWLGNPKCPADQRRVDQVDLLLVTHGHADHLGDAIEIASEHAPVVVGMFELCTWLVGKGVETCSPMNTGGTQTIGDIKVTMVSADHSSGIIDDGRLVPGGEAAGYVIELETGFKLYHAGDTNVFGDMRLIGELYRPDVAMLPIGGHFTMSPREAARAVRMLEIKRIIPMHFGTFPLLKGTPDELREELLDGEGVEVVELQPGETTILTL